MKKLIIMTNAIRATVLALFVALPFQSDAQTRALTINSSGVVVNTNSTITATNALVLGSTLEITNKVTARGASDFYGVLTNRGIQNIAGSPGIGLGVAPPGDYNAIQTAGILNLIPNTQEQVRITGGTDTTGTVPLLELIRTWQNGTALFTGIKLNITDSGSQSQSLLADYQVGSATKWRVDRNGVTSQANDLTFTVPTSISWTAQNAIVNDSNGILTIRDASSSQNFLLRFGGASSSHAAIQSLGTTLRARKADDSGNVIFSADSLTIGGGSTTDPSFFTTSFDGESAVVRLGNINQTASANASAAMLFDLADTGGSRITGAKILLGKEATWTPTAGTQDGFIYFTTILNGSNGERLRISSNGLLTPNSDVSAANQIYAVNAANNSTLLKTLAGSGSVSVVFTDDNTITITGSGGSVAGSDKQVQFNDGGAFGGDAGLTYDKTADQLNLVSYQIRQTNSITTLGSSNNAFNAGNASYIPMKAQTGGNSIITGIQSRAGDEGRILHIMNVGDDGDNIKFLVDNGDAASTNTIKWGTSQTSDFFLQDHDSVTLIYDTNALSWKALSLHSTMRRAGTITMAATSSTGVSNYVIGFRPRMITFHAMSDADAAIYSSGEAGEHVADGGTGTLIDACGRHSTTVDSMSQTKSIHIESGVTGNGWSGNVSGYNKDGFSINWTELAAGSDVTVKYIAVP